ncbi:F-type H+-transporting ATPase subunit delta [Pseudonocardia sediminis]|uniref:ATP synthase subunit delta n=1 Tax=Pseudonocardia sediminis TaxID=1397368 RepID=A0A4Q7V3P2_PSEST|nr:F0F1 ATP synthase subunit delta [Pseudonocardia sediminis]RZT88061.1 F-type H+-transporting ATPase subunit delta [Pseudonocardia sediminis]
MVAVLQPSSRKSLATLVEQLDSYVDRTSAEELSTTAGELFSVTRLLAGERELRRVLADDSSPEESRVQLVERVLGGQLSAPTMDLVRGLVTARWSASINLVDAAESLARQATLSVADKDGSLDDVEDQLFRFGRILDQQPELAGLLADTTEPAEGRIGLLDRVLGNQAAPVTSTLLNETLRLPRGRHLDVAAEELADLAAARRGRSVARVRTPVALSEQQESTLADTLARIYGRTISLQIELDPSLLGGLVVQVGGEVIDGSVAGKLAAARRSLPS